MEKLLKLQHYEDVLFQSKRQYRKMDPQLKDLIVDTWEKRHSQYLFGWGGKIELVKIESRPIKHVSLDCIEGCKCVQCFQKYLDGVVAMSDASLQKVV